MKITGYGVFVWIFQIGNIYSFRENCSSGRLDSGSEPRLGQTKEKKRNFLLLRWACSINTVWIEFGIMCPSEVTLSTHGLLFQWASTIVRVPILTRTRNDAPRCIRVLFINRKTYDVRSLRFVYVDGSVRCYIPQHVENTRKQGKKLSSFFIHIKPPFFLTPKRSLTKIDPRLAYNLQSVVKNLRLLTGCTGIFGHVTNVVSIPY